MKFVKVVKPKSLPKVYLMRPILLGIFQMSINLLNGQIFLTLLQLFDFTKLDKQIIIKNSDIKLQAPQYIQKDPY